MDSYKVLYVEDSDPESAKGAFELEGLEVEVNDASNFDSFIDQIEKSAYDAYILDFRLTSKAGRVDAPTYASMLRSSQIDDEESKLKLKKAPLILFSTEDNLKYFDKDFTSQDLFDLVDHKPTEMTGYKRLSGRIKALIDGYRTIESNSYEIEPILGLGESELDLDCHLCKTLTESVERKDSYALCRTIYQTVIRSSGLLVGEDILAARLGVDKKSEAWGSFLSSQLSGCKYTGIMSSAYDRWWMHRVLNQWQEWSGGQTLRRLKAEERVKILSEEANGNNLKAAEPIKENVSTCFWTICAILNKPLDPMEGYLYNKRERKLWEEQDYASLFGLLEYPNEQNYISLLSQKEVRSYR